LLVNSFPRTGNRFFIFCAEKYLDIDKIITNKNVLHDISLLNKAEINQVIIFRDPKDTIVSFNVLKLLLHNTNITLEQCVTDFIKWNQEFAKNIDTLYPFTFEQTTKQIFRCLDALASTLHFNKQDNKDIEILYSILASKRGGYKNPQSVQQSSKVDPRYFDVLREYKNLSPSVIAELYDIELYMRRLIQKRQNDLGWAIPN
jgi:hypothetical protein